MKRALVFSDSHGRMDNMREVVKQYPDIEAIFHLGDIEGDEERLRYMISYPVYMVRGNCDYSPDLRPELNVEFGGKKIAMCHGHRYLNAGGVDMFRYWAMEQKADIAMFGHTHIPYLEQGENLILLNPGSIERPRQEKRIPTFTVMEIHEDGQVCFQMKEFRKRP